MIIYFLEKFKIVVDGRIEKNYKKLSFSMMDYLLLNKKQLTHLTLN